jgi:hypothetical protein
MSNRAPRLSAKNIVLLANAFRDLIREELTPAQLRLVDELNARRRDGSCATHDYLDANEVMQEAYEDTFHYPFNVMSDVALQLWDHAWNVCVVHGFATEASIVLDRSRGELSGS